MGNYRMTISVWGAVMPEAPILSGESTTAPSSMLAGWPGSGWWGWASVCWVWTGPGWTPGLSWWSVWVRAAGWWPGCPGEVSLHRRLHPGQQQQQQHGPQRGPPPDPGVPSCSLMVVPAHGDPQAGPVELLDGGGGGQAWMDGVPATVPWVTVPGACAPVTRVHDSDHSPLANNHQPDSSTSSRPNFHHCRDHYTAANGDSLPIHCQCRSRIYILRLLQSFPMWWLASLSLIDSWWMGGDKTDTNAVARSGQQPPHNTQLAPPWAQCLPT